MDAVGQGVLPALVPSQRPGVSCPLYIAAGECTRCGRPTEPGNIWSICPSCDPGAAVASPSSVVVKQHPTANCTACRVALRVPSHYQTAHVLCPPCQARHAAMIHPKPQDRVVPRGNAYPVVTPMAKSTRGVALTVAYTYPDLPAPSPTSPSLQSVGAVAGGGVPTSVNYAQDVAYTYPDPPAPSPTSSSLQSVGVVACGGVPTNVNHAQDALWVCGRFGCGARLPAHVLGDICEACAGAGSVRPPRAVAQKRIPRRATDHTRTRPRESRDLVRASLMREAARTYATVTTERKDVEDENEMEVDLVYPDDIPVATQCASTTSESKGEGSKPTEEEDVELELVYPEDAAETTETSSKPRPTVFPPTTLRELFADGLQTIPALQNLTALVDTGPPRHCQTPGCNEALPAQTRMERCVKCSIGDWKRRKLASADIDPPRRPSTSLLSTTTTMEEREVTTEISDVEDEGDFPPPSSSPSKNSSNGPTADHGVRPIPGWDSDLTELSSSDSDSESVSDSESNPDHRLGEPHGDTTRLTIRIPLLVNRLPPDCLLRKCGNKRCNIALPKDHQWKTCDPCRRAQRTYHTLWLENKRRSTLGIEMSTPPDLHCRRWRSLSPGMRETDATLTLETSRPCSTRRCGSRIPLPEVYRWKTCTGCRARARRKARRKAHRKRDALAETRHASRQPEIVPRFPAYQNRGGLLSSFDAQLKGFVEGQIMYLRAKLHDSEARGQGVSESWKPEHAPMIFDFAGEYSIVTGQRGDSEGNSHSYDRDDSRSRDDPAELEAMRQEVSSIVLDLERALRAKFRPGEAFMIDKGGIIMRFTCSLELIAQLRPLTTPAGPDSGPSSASDSYANARRSDEDTEAEVPLTLKPPPNTPAVPLLKTLSGKLEAVVVPDESHRLFRGRRTVVRYCMLG